MALSRAAWNGHNDIEKMLIEAGADVNKQYNDGMTALYKAAENGHNDIAKILIEAGADVNIQDKDGLKPLKKYIHAMLAQRGAHGRTRIGLTGLYLQLDISLNFLSHVNAPDG